MTVRRVLLVALLGAALAMVYFAQKSDHRVFLNGNVVTVDFDNTIAQAVSIRDGIIEAVGSNKEIQQLINDNTIVTDLNGRTLLPGFIDAHSHFPGSGFTSVSIDISQPPVGQISSINGILDKLRNSLHSGDNGHWLIGFGYDDSTLQETRHPTRTELDSVSDTRPIYLWHSSGHMGVANSAGLERLGIDKHSEVPNGGVIGRDNNGSPNGLLQESAAPSLATITEDLSPFDYYRILQRANDEYIRNGITTAQSGAINTSLFSALSWATRFRLLPFRLVVFPRYDELGEQLRSGKISRDDNDKNWFKIGPVKLFADGSPQGYTAYLSEPYFRPPPGGNPGYRGFPAAPQSELTANVKALHQAGLQVAIHGNGDAAIDNIIEALSHSSLNRDDDPRTILVHAQMARRDQLLKMRELGVTPSFFITHTYYWGDVHSRRAMGPERAANMSPAGDAEKLGLRFSLHSDAPVTPSNPLQILWSAVNRKSLSGNVIGDHQRISLMSAIRAVTIDAAWQVFIDDTRGSIEPGKFADLVVLSGDLLNHDGDIRELRIDETIVAGKLRYSRE